MGVTFYLFDTHQQVRAPLVEGVAEWIHHEGQHTLDAAIPVRHQARPGEYLGMLCVDDRWRLFCITEAEDDDEKGLTYIKATDAAVDDLTYLVVQDAYQQEVTARQAVEMLLQGTGWSLGTVTASDDLNTTDAQWQSRWDALGTVASVFGVRILPYYVIEHGEITARLVDVLDDTPVYRGRFYQSQLDARNVTIIRANRPITVLYGLGKAEGTGDQAQRVTIADATWSKANGDPADKPAGQLWVEDPEAVAIYGRREQTLVANDVTDPMELLEMTWDELQKQKKPRATVDATIRDMEQVPGQEWKIVRINDKVAVRTVAGEDALARIIDIDQDYIKQERTKLKAGDELPSAKKQLASLARSAIHTQETLTIYRNRFHHDEALIQLNADTIQANAKLIQVNAEEIEVAVQELTLQAGRIEENGQMTETIRIELDGLTGTVEAQAETIRLKADRAELELAEGKIEANAEQIALQGGEISLKADRAELELAEGKIEANAEQIALQGNEIELQADTIRQKADLILLDGYVKVTELAATNAAISNLTSGLTTATVLRATLLTGDQVYATYGEFSALTHAGALVSQRKVTMGEVSSVGSALSTGGELDLQHSHKVSVADDGTVTFGEVSSSGGSFKIADTKAYKDGVSAAYGNGYNVGFADGKDAYMPTAINRTGYDTTAKTVTVRALNSHQDLLTGIDISAEEIYEAGRTFGRSEMGIVRDNDTVTVGVSDTKSMRAYVHDTHYVIKGSQTNLTPGTLFTGTAGAYYYGGNIALGGSAAVWWE